MFRNIETGDKILDADYKRHYTTGVRRAKQAAAKAAEAAAATEDRDDVVEYIAEDGELDFDLTGGLSFDGSRNAFETFLDCIYGTDVEGLPGNFSTDAVTEMVEAFNEAYCGTWGSERDYTEDLIEQGVLGDAAEGPLGQYVDVDALTRDLFMSDFWSDKAPGHEVHVFRNC